MNKYLCVFERTRTGYSAYVPDLPGCISTGRNRKEVEKNIQESIEFHIEGMSEDGKKFLNLQITLALLKQKLKSRLKTIKQKEQQQEKELLHNCPV